MTLVHLADEITEYGKSAGNASRKTGVPDLPRPVTLPCGESPGFLPGASNSKGGKPPPSPPALASNTSLNRLYYAPTSNWTCTSISVLNHENGSPSATRRPRHIVNHMSSKQVCHGDVFPCSRCRSDIAGVEDAGISVAPVNS